jgi:hypothetical protein
VVRFQAVSRGLPITKVYENCCIGNFMQAGNRRCERTLRKQYNKEEVGITATKNKSYYKLMTKI